MISFTEKIKWKRTDRDWVDNLHFSFPQRFRVRLTSSSFYYVSWRHWTHDGRLQSYVWQVCVPNDCPQSPRRPERTRSAHGDKTLFRRNYYDKHIKRQWKSLIPWVNCSWMIHGPWHVTYRVPLILCLEIYRLPLHAHICDCYWYVTHLRGWRCVT